MKKYFKWFKIALLFAGMNIFTDCADYLDIIPDNVATIDDAFSNEINAERFLFGCYNYLPDVKEYRYSSSLLTGDEWWWNDDNPIFRGYNSIRISLGYQNSNGPLIDFWNGGNGGVKLWQAIRDCNIFLENIHTVPDIFEWKRSRWIAEVKFLKAYFHFYLMHLYGPIPIIRENAAVNDDPEKVRVYREPVDDVVNYIVELIDEAVKDLPLEVFSSSITDAGRITKPIALAVKAKTLVWAASPLFNNNSDYLDFKDSRGRQLTYINPEEPGKMDVKKWERAATAIKNAIDTAHLAGHNFYEYIPTLGMSNTTKLKYTLRGAVTDVYNREIIWPTTIGLSGKGDLQALCQPLLGSSYANNKTTDVQELSAPLHIAEQFYTNNGIPIDEDPEWVLKIGGSLSNRYETQAASADHQYYIKLGQQTARLNFYREPRFYAFLGFDRSIWEGNGQTEANSHQVEARMGEQSGYVQRYAHIQTGYYVKKLVSTGTRQGENNYYPMPYSFPIIRLTDLYLLYAEALNESLPGNNDAPPAEVYEYVDKVRRRAGLLGVKESWIKSTNPSKPNSKLGMREIIRRERLIELSFEGQRLPDLRRWKEAAKYMNIPVQGWNYEGFKLDDYYQVKTYFQRNYTTKDYLWPIKLADMNVNGNLVQNPYW
jgi:hypothetical protein